MYVPDEPMVGVSALKRAMLLTFAVTYTVTFTSVLVYLYIAGVLPA